MVKRKSSDSHEGESDNFVPLPVQLFFWRQTSPFIRAKMGKLCDASCVSFERVLVQNILHGLSPSLCEAMQKIPRWRLVQAAFPHVLTCCAAVLAKRKQSYPDAKFGQSETKLLYTLHWVVLDAASECEDNDPHESGSSTASLIQSQLHDLSAIQLFVYLFAPLVCSVHEQDFQTLKLERGLMLWEPLWECRQPDIPCFLTPVKPKRTILKAVRQKENRIKSNIADIYLGNGEGPSTPEDMFLGFPSAASTSGMAAIAQTPEGPPLAPLASISEIYTESISDGSAVFIQNICEICRSPSVSRDGMSPTCNCSRRVSDDVFLRPQLRQSLSVPESSEYTQEEDQGQEHEHEEEQNVADDILLATYFDVAVLQCLFCPRWDEDGIFWALGYMHKRLLDICDELARHANVRRRSQSLPVPDIKVLDPPTLTLPTTLLGKLEEMPTAAAAAATETDQEFLKHANFHLDSMNSCQHKREYQQPNKKRCEEGHIGHHGLHLGHHHPPHPHHPHPHHPHPPPPDLHQ
ncbi:protein unc-80-like, partial [Lingula anatina]|uniref:Protein unc-80-like n=1 Tax=Lingula anatina TaxID=7574 RepID=A0A2R2MLK1_LINAN